MIAFFIELLDLPGFKSQDKIFGANVIFMMPLPFYSKWLYFNIEL